MSESTDRAERERWKPLIEAVEQEVGTGAGAWDLVYPADILAAAVKHARLAPPAAPEAPQPVEPKKCYYPECWRPATRYRRGYPICDEHTAVQAALEAHEGRHPTPEEKERAQRAIQIADAPPPPARQPGADTELVERLLAELIKAAWSQGYYEYGPGTYSKKVQRLRSELLARLSAPAGALRKRVAEVLARELAPVWDVDAERGGKLVDALVDALSAPAGEREGDKAGVVSDTSSVTDPDTAEREDDLAYAQSIMRQACYLLTDDLQRGDGVLTVEKVREAYTLLFDYLHTDVEVSREHAAEFAAGEREARAEVADDGVEYWWGAARLAGPFTPSGRGDNDGKVRDGRGNVVADCGGSEARADVVAGLLNRFAAARAALEGDR